MPQQHKLTLWQATLININIMFGTGIFINTVNLTKLTGGLGFVSYIAAALLVLPILLVLARLMKLHPSGGFYTYGSENISDFAGFISAWSYFVGKLGSAALLIHVFSSLIFTIFPALYQIPYAGSPLILDALVIALFAWLNFFALKTGNYLMYLFIVLKFTPVLFTILSGLYFYTTWSFPVEELQWSGIPITLPLVLFAFVGFESACAITHSMKNPEQDGPRSIFYAFSAVIGTTILFQFILYNMIGFYMYMLPDFLGLFPTWNNLLFADNPELAIHLTRLLHVAIAVASLGGSYAIMLTNQWNLNILAEHGHIFGSSLFTFRNKHRIPVMCVITEALLCISYLMLTQGEAITLQQISVFGCTIAYIMSIFSYISIALRTNKAQTPWLGYTALAASLVFLITCLRNFLYIPLYGFITIGTLLLGGILMFIIRKTQTVALQNKA